MSKDYDNHDFHIAFFNSQNENLRKRLESVRTLFAFWFTTLGGIAFIAFDQIKTSRFLETSIILFLGALVSFLIGNMITKNQYHINQLKVIIENTEVYKTCDKPETHKPFKAFHIRESVIDILMFWVVPFVLLLLGVLLLIFRLRLT